MDDEENQYDNAAYHRYKAAFTAALTQMEEDAQSSAEKSDAFANALEDFYHCEGFEF